MSNTPPLENPFLAAEDSNVPICPIGTLGLASAVGYLMQAKACDRVDKGHCNDIAVCKIHYFGANELKIQGSPFPEKDKNSRSECAGL